MAKSKNVYTIYAERKTSQFNQKKQVMRCRIIEAHRSFIVVESMKRYNKKYSGSAKATGTHDGLPVRRINKEQACLILDENTGKWIAYETLRRREGTPQHPGRSRGGK